MNNAVSVTPVRDDEQLKQYVVEWVSLDNDLREAAKHMRIMRKRRTELGEEILAYMQRHRAETCNVSEIGETLECATTSRVVSMSKTVISDNLKEFFMDLFKKGGFQSLAPELAAEEATTFIYEHRDRLEKSVLKRKKK